MTEITKDALAETSCSIAKTKLINGVNIDLKNLELDDKSSKCSGTINVKIDSETYKEIIDNNAYIAVTQKKTLDMTNVICK